MKKEVGGATAAVCVGILLATGCAKVLKPGDPLPGLNRDEMDRFERVRAVFDRVFTPETGLGPLFNADACNECHEDPVSGGPGDEIEVHATEFRPGENVCNPLVERGGPIIQQAVTPALKQALGIDREPFPVEATGRGLRTTPDILGFGLLDAVPDEAILALADPDDRNGDGIAGRPNRFFDGRLGRFGRKALVPTLREFNDGAFVIEQGITSPAVPTEETIGGNPVPPGVDPVPEPEIRQQDLDLTNDFVRFLGPPSPEKLTYTAKLGRKTFERIGCDGCHVPTLKTGRHPVKALRYKNVAAYTDMLLHDMGPDLADTCLGLAEPSHFRTEPLMGIRLSAVFLHDGRAKTIEEAIRLHGGEASRSRDRFAALSHEDRRALLEFLGSL